jgi:nitroreductase
MSISRYPQFFDLTMARYSCRSYSTAPVDEDLITAILETAQLAPSACNRQPWTFVVVRDKERRRRLLAKSRPAFVEAPVLIVACGHRDSAWVRPIDGKNHTDIDVAIAVEHICLAATTLDLATCWVCNFDVDAARDELNLPQGVEPIALIPLGYPASDSVAPSKVRKPLDEIVKWENF